MKKKSEKRSQGDGKDMPSGIANWGRKEKREKPEGFYNLPAAGSVGGLSWTSIRNAKGRGSKNRKRPMRTLEEMTLDGERKTVRATAMYAAARKWIGSPAIARENTSDPGKTSMGEGS